MIVCPNGIKAKCMVMALLGTIEMTWPAKQLTFIKQARFSPRGQYPHGCHLIVYIGPDTFMVEMDTHGEEQTPLLGDTINHTETWKVVDKVLDRQNPDQITELMHI